MPPRPQSNPSPARSQVDLSTRRILRQVAHADAAEVLAAARDAARQRAAAILEEALVEELLSAVGQAKPIGADTTAPAAPDGTPSAVSQSEPSSAWWAYCVVAAERAGGLAAGLRGVEPGSPVEAVSEGDLAMLVSQVPLSEYGDDQLREHLEDISWLERTARAHEAVQEAVLSHEALVPLRLCTIYRDVERVRAALRQNSEVFARNLMVLGGAKEWGVKVFLDPRRASTPSAPGDSTPAGSPPGAQSGTAYLAGRQRERDQVARSDELAERCVGEVRLAVGELSIGERVNPVQPPQAHGRDAEMIFNGANLVADGRAAELRAAVSALQAQWEDRGLLVELTGPWPPYNFVSESAGMFS